MTWNILLLGTVSKATLPVVVAADDDSTFPTVIIF